MIKVLHISTHKIGGAGNAAYRLHLALNETKEISSKFLYRSEEPSNISTEQNITSKKHTLLHRIANKLGIPLLAWHKNRKIIDSHKGNYEKISFPENDFEVEKHPWVKEADIIHLHWISDFVNYTTFFKVLKNKPMVWTLHDMNAFKGLFHYQDDENRNKEVFRGINQKINELKFKAIKNVSNLELVCPSNWLAKKANQSSLFLNKKIHIIPYSLPEKWFILNNKEAAQQKFNLDTKLITFLFVALDIDIERKGIQLLMDALSLIPKQSIQCLVVGNRDYNFGEQKVVKTGYIADENDMIEAYAAADVYILPSKEDNLPNVMLEAFAQGKPVISYKNGGMAEWIKDGFNGYLCKNINVEELVEKINLFTKQPHVFNKEAINEFAISHFLPIHQSKGYEEVYKKLMP